MEMKKILWPTDFSGTAERALSYVTSLSRKYDTEVHVLYVIPDVAHHVDWYGQFEPSHIERIVAWEKKKAKERLDQICENHLQGCPLYVKHIALGDPAEEILKLIDHEKVDMVVMTSRGATGHFPFGSVTEKVVKNSPVPVITIPVSPQGMPQQWGEAAMEEGGSRGMIEVHGGQLSVSLNS